MPLSYAVGCSNRAEKRAREGRTTLALQILLQENEVRPHDTWLVIITLNGFSPSDASRICSEHFRRNDLSTTA